MGLIDLLRQIAGNTVSGAAAGPAIGARVVEQYAPAVGHGLAAGLHGLVTLAGPGWMPPQQGQPGYSGPDQFQPRPGETIGQAYKRLLQMQESLRLLAAQQQQMDAQ